MTICQIRKNDAEARVRAMRDNGWKRGRIRLPPGAAARATDVTSDPVSNTGAEDADIEADTVPEDLEQLARDQIARTLYAKYKGCGMEELVAAILRAQGFTVHSPDRGPDGGAWTCLPHPVRWASARLVSACRSRARTPRSIVRPSINCSAP